MRQEIVSKSADQLQNSMTRQEFKYAVYNGAKYVILDSLVLDVEQFMSHHPGGKFVLNHLVGTDISKFFYGGYSLEDNATNVRGHNHSNQAKMIANDIAVAVYEKDIEVCHVQVDQCLKDSHQICTDVHLVVLCAEKPISAFKLLHTDFRILGKHFRVFN
jgi:cytochrome b involved in lipid metabolism